ncbi:MAG: GTP-binding protein [Mailhella sp.]|nr:GTP-binding protein [Mailhella sp.]
MRLDSIFPRPIGDGGSDCASLLTTLIMAAHFDRSEARALGWRGVRPAAAPNPCWTCRVAGSELVFGMRFDGELRGGHGGMPVLHGYFSLYAFPRGDSPLLESFPLDALRTAMDEGYGAALREFSGEDAFDPFLFGRLVMDAACDGTALCLSLEAPARHRVVSLDGIADGRGGWIVAPGGEECSVPAFRLFLPLFAALAATAEKQLGEPAAVALSSSFRPRMGFRAGGGMEPVAELRDAVPALHAVFGRPLSAEAEGARPLRSLPARHVPEPLEGAGLPVLHVLTGFLGSGKTTFLRRWLDFLHGRERYTGVIQNEFGSIALDAAMLAGDTVVEALDEGCVCCSLADSLRPGIERIVDAMPAEQFVLETTGVANPSNIMAAMEGLRDLVRPGLVITVADALDLSAGQGGFPADSGVRREQIMRADVVILNKAGDVPAPQLDALAAKLHALNPRALILPASYGSVPFGELDAFIDAHGKGRLPSRGARLDAFGRLTHAEEGFESRTLFFDDPVSEETLSGILRDAGAGLSRAKGIINIENKGLCVVQWAAGRLEIDPCDAEEPAGLAVIGTDLRIPDGGMA